MCRRLSATHTLHCPALHRFNLCETLLTAWHSFDCAGAAMNFSQFETTIDQADGKAFERTLATAAINGEWSRVEQMLRNVTEDCPDLQLRHTLLNDIDHAAIVCKGWDRIERAIQAGQPAHIVFRIDGNALYDVLYREGYGPDDDHAVGFEIGLADRAVVSDARLHGEAIAATVAAASWTVPATGETSVVYVTGLNHVYRAMRIALCDDEDKYPLHQGTAMFRLCGWWIGLAMNRYMADHCKNWAVNPTVPVFVSSKLGGGRLLGWHIPGGPTTMVAEEEHIANI